MTSEISNTPQRHIASGGHISPYILDDVLRLVVRKLYRWLCAGFGGGRYCRSPNDSLIPDKRGAISVFGLLGTVVSQSLNIVHFVLFLDNANRFGPSSVVIHGVCRTPQGGMMNSGCPKILATDAMQPRVSHTSCSGGSFRSGLSPTPSQRVLHRQQCGSLFGPGDTPPPPIIRHWPTVKDLKKLSLPSAISCCSVVVCADSTLRSPRGTQLVVKFGL
jgi:hypothetical protein